MPSLIFRLRNVPDDEAADVRALLDEHRLAWFETTAGNWGIAMPGLWLEDEADHDRARSLIDDYQRSRVTRLRAEREARLADGLEPRFIDRLRERPIAIAAIVSFCAFIVYAMLAPFVRLAGLAG